MLTDKIVLGCANCSSQIEDGEECYTLNGKYYCSDCIIATTYEAPTIAEYFADELREGHNDG